MITPRGYPDAAAGSPERCGEDIRPCRRRPPSFLLSTLDSPRSTAFTLIELLVVIAVIAVLAALLLPVLAKAKASARRLECVNHQRQWAVAFHEYVDDNEGWLPREGYHNNGLVWVNNWSQVQNAASKDVWYNALASFLSIRPASSYAPSEARPSFYERSSFFHCPSARFPKALSPQIALFSMAMNSQIIEPPDDFPTVKLARIRNPSQTVLLLDNLLEEETPVVEEQSPDNLGQPAAFANRFAGRRHGRTGIITFADGHGEPVAGNKVVETTGPNAGWAILPPVEIYWDPE